MNHDYSLHKLIGSKINLEGNKVEMIIPRDPHFKDERWNIEISWTKKKPSEWNQCGSKTIQTGKSGVIQSNYSGL